MTKYICIESSGHRFIVGDIYNIVVYSYSGTDMCEIFDSSKNLMGTYWIKCCDFFKPLSQYREEQLNEILND